MLALLNFTKFVQDSGYAAIFVLSVLQSCCVPTSSELTLAFAGYWAYKGHFNLAAVIVIAVAGEVVGAYIAWFIGRYAGRGFFDRFGKYLLLTHHDLDRAEAWYHRRGNWGVFGGRLIPVIRNFVAVPAGLAEVPLLRFGALTAAGSAVWLTLMAVIGYEAGSSYDKITKGFSDAGYVIAAVAVAGIAFVVYHRYRSYKAQTSGAGPAHRQRPASEASEAVAAESISRRQQP